MGQGEQEKKRKLEEQEAGLKKEGENEEQQSESGDDEEEGEEKVELIVKEMSADQVGTFKKGLLRFVKRLRQDCYDLDMQEVGPEFCDELSKYIKQAS